MPEYEHIRNKALEHINYSLPNIVNNSYKGGYWIGSFAIYTLNSSQKKP